MSDWKTKLTINENKDYEQKEPFCTGWGIVDGVIYCLRKAKEYFNNRKQLKGLKRNTEEM